MCNQANVQVGYARTDISPLESVPLRGYGSTSNRMSTHVLDPLYATCLAMTDDTGKTVLLYGLDLIAPSTPWETTIVSAISEATGIPEDHIFASGTHTHSGPDMENPDEPSIPRYVEHFKLQAIRAAQLALADRKPAQLFGTSVQTQMLNFVRRFILQDGSPAGDNYGPWGTSPISHHETEADHCMQLLKFVREGGSDIIIANFQGHPQRVGINKELYYKVSADIVGVMRTEMEWRTGCRFLYFTGGSGNVNPFSRVLKERFYSNHLDHGKAMAAAAYSVLDNFRPLKLGAIKTDWVTLDCPTDHTQDHRVEDALYVHENFRATGKRSEWEPEALRLGFHSVYHAGFVVAKSKRPKTVPVTLRSLSIGDVAFALAPYEMFDTNGMQIKEGSPFAMTMVLTCANGANRGYVPSALGFANGGYSVDSCWFLPGAGERFADELIAGLKRMHE